MQKKSVNLLQKRGAPPTFWERLYEWMTNTCRIIVVLTEVLVLGAFGWRFWLDRTINDLNDDIERKGEVLKSLSEQEQEIRLIQTKVDTYRTIWNASSNFSPIFEELNRYIPDGVDELVVSISSSREFQSMSVSGEVEREKIDKLENNLKDSNTFTDVVLSTIQRKSSGTESRYVFTIEAKILLNQSRGPLSSYADIES
ncbi:MAG: PilN domain-containing protein [Patescibacteria group bacterium]|nr:PilN domain-containing protein [Patescibacteria group bacterium]